MSSSAKAFFLAGLVRESEHSVLVISYNTEQAEQMAEELAQFGLSEDEIHFLPATDDTVFEEGSPDFRAIGERLSALDALLSGKRTVVVGPISAVLQRTMPVSELAGASVSLSVGETRDVDDLLFDLVSLGYERAQLVDRPGEFSRRGGILDVYPSNHEHPIRIEFFGDEVESIRMFDVASQRSTEKRQSARILSAREVKLSRESVDQALPILRAEFEEQLRRLEEDGQAEQAGKLRDRMEADFTRLNNLAYFDNLEFYLPYLFPQENSVLDYLPPDTLVVIDEPHQAKAQWAQLEEDLVERLLNRANRGALLASRKPHHLRFESAMQQVARNRRVLSFALMPRRTTWLNIDEHFHLEAPPMDSFGGRMQILADQVKTWIDNGLAVVAATAQDHRVAELFGEFDVPASPADDLYSEKPGLFVLNSRLKTGFKLPDARMMIITDSEIFGITRMHRPRRASREGIPITTLLDLKEGDYVVHISHGIGIYRGLVTLHTDGKEREYLLLEYSGSDKLYVPSDQIDRVQKYIGGEGNPPVIHKIGGSDWSRTTKRVKSAVREMAKELVELYAWRQALDGYGYSPDSPWQQEMESAFPYQETPDQMEAIQEVKHDLEQPRAMDRLICGDVGYGKTEVAVRAAFKVVTDGRQVAILAPTTVLAQQHLNTFKERLAAFPIQIEMLSRFRTKKEQQNVLEGLRIGTVDIVIGTHRLLSKDVEFKDLGLLVVDEEQRFGVSHKEKLKQMKKTVDVLTMTATPIPRTLHMSLSGIRDMSLIDDPPEGRMPIKTFVREYDDDVVRDAIVRELDRGGQVFVVHNRVENIGHVAAHYARLVPHARIDVGHGQMPESELERVMLDFYEHRFDVLVCTTIIESGLDIPNANTLIVNNADKMGLAQLYQLRGRVGRSDRQAYAYLFYKGNKILTEVAEKRLDALREFTDLGSGFRVAMRDLEIRGAGNLLGAEQHGQMVSVGFDLYCQLLSQAVAELKGEEVTEVNLPPVDLPIDAYLPESYVSEEAQRIFFYKKMAAAKDEHEVRRIQDELEDRFGDPPKPVWNMLALLRLRMQCQKIGIAAITPDKRQLNIRFVPGIRIPEDDCRDLGRRYRQHWFYPERVVINLFANEPILQTVEQMVDVLARVLSGLRVAGRVR